MYFIQKSFIKKEKNIAKDLGNKLDFFIQSKDLGNKLEATKIYKN